MLAVAAGCVETGKKDVYYVMFEDNPLLFSDKVYSGGEEIGAIASRVVGFDNIAEVTITLLPAHKEKIGGNTIFYVSAGRLEHDITGAAGSPLAPGDATLGFPSKSSLKWYKLKGVLSRSTVKKTAELLRTKIQWVEPVEIPI